MSVCLMDPMPALLGALCSSRSPFPKPLLWWFASFAGGTFVAAPESLIRMSACQAPTVLTSSAMNILKAEHLA